MKKTYNTGKVQIGIAYEPKNVYEVSRDMELLQRALLEQRKERWAEVLYCIGLLMAFGYLVSLWIFR